MIFGYSIMHGGIFFDPDAKRHFDRLSLIDNQLMRDVNNFIVNLKDIGVWSLLDDVCVHHLNQVDSLRGLKGSFDSIYVLDGAAVSGWSSGSGFRCDLQSSGNTRYINTNINDTVSGQLADDDMSLFAYRTDYSGMPLSFCGGDLASSPNYDSIAIEPTGEFWGGNQTTGSADVSTTALTTGFIGGARRSGNDVEIRVGANSNIEATASSFGASPIDIYVGCRNLAGTPFLLAHPTDHHTVSGWGVGSGLTSQQLSDLRDAMDAYMSARGL